MKPQYLAILSLLVLALVGVWIWEYWDMPSLSSLTRKALSSEVARERELSAIKTAMFNDSRDAAPYLRRILLESKDPKVRLHAIRRLSYFNDPGAWLGYAEALDAPEREVREAAWVALKKSQGGGEYEIGPAGNKEKVLYSPDDSAADRTKWIVKLRDFIQNPPPAPGE